MAPVIRIDDEVMETLKQHAMRLGLVFESPNATLRAILVLDRNLNEGTTYTTGSDSKSVEIEIKNIHSAREWALIPIPKAKRAFFPGFKVNFELVTDIGTVTTHVTSEIGGGSIGAPMDGKYIQTGLREWFDKHPALGDGAKLQIRALEPRKRYQLSIIRNHA